MVGGIGLAFLAPLLDLENLSTFGNDVKNTQQAFLAPLPGKVDY